MTTADVVGLKKCLAQFQCTSQTNRPTHPRDMGLADRERLFIDSSNRVNGMFETPNIRIRNVNGSAVHVDGEYVLYWMIAFRRTQWNFSLQRAVEWARELKKPLVVFEALRAGYRWASDRLHHFVIQGMADNARRLARKPVLYYPYLEPKLGAGKGLLAALAKRSCVVVSDDFPCFFLPRMIDSATDQILARFELVDSNGLLPMRAADKVFARAFDFRRFLQKNLAPYLDDMPEATRLSGHGCRNSKACRQQLPASGRPPTSRNWPVIWTR